MLLKLNKVSFAYQAGESPALRDLSLHLRQGDLLGLLGPNGAGKTTLVSLITGIRQPDSGTITIAGQPARLGRQDVALVPQEYAFYERLSGRENLHYFAGILGLRSADAANAVARAVAHCGLQDVIDKRASAYSGGLKRRLNFAIALLQNPRLLILDEPTAGVDPHSRSFLLDAVRELNNAGVSVIYTSHLLDEVQTLCNRIAVMDEGRLLMQGSMDELLAQSQKVITVVLDRPLDSIGVAGCDLAASEGNSVKLRLGQASPVAQLHALEKAGYGITQIHYGGKRLEELFFELTHRELRD